MRFVQDLNLTGRRVLVRLDLNVPLAAGKVTDDTRARAVVPTIHEILAQRPRQIIMLSHFGRPDEGCSPSEQLRFSLKPVLPLLEEFLGRPVYFATDIAAASQTKKEIVLLENTRFLVGEKNNHPQLAQNLADLGDAFVMDAFASAHRAHASTHGMAERIQERGAGLLVQRELAALNRALNNPERPLAVVMGGAKVEDKLPLLEKFTSLADILIVGGGIANTFLAACGKRVGESLYEPSYQEKARKIMGETQVPLPIDVAVTRNLDEDSERREKTVDDIESDEMIVDVGSRTQALYAERLIRARTVIWNGPLGIFEKPAYENGTRSLARTIAASDAFTLAGGGDTVAAVNQFVDARRIDFISTGGGAFLEYIEKGRLPALEVLN